MTFNSLVKATALVLALATPQALLAGGAAAPLPTQDWEHKGMFGEFDNNQMKRGAQVTVEVCMGCHSVKYIKFDFLRQFGFTEQEVKDMAESQGQTKKSRMISSMSEEDAKDSFGVIPPDLSLMTKARKGYEDYTYAMLTGYLNEDESELINNAMEDDALSDSEIQSIAAKLHLNPDDPEKVKEVVTRIQNGENFNKYYPGNFFAMPQPLMADQVEYADGTKTDLHQLAKDTTAFLAWAAEPTLMERKSTGKGVLLYLILLTALLYAIKRRMWSKLH
ncbi:MAG: hypothetical protein HQL50_00890 [Magnetococcales bacterium]|nr:hypothetical protein [Magnetococcales bacterium]